MKFLLGGNTNDKVCTLVTRENSDTRMSETFLKTYSDM